MSQRNHTRSPQSSQRLTEIACWQQHVSSVLCREQNDVHGTRKLPVLKSVVEQVYGSLAIIACCVAIRLGHATGLQALARNVHRACQTLREQQRLIANIVPRCRPAAHAG